jgi:hypothetical protein
MILCKIGTAPAPPQKPFLLLFSDMFLWLLCVARSNTGRIHTRRIVIIPSIDFHLLLRIIVPHLYGNEWRLNKMANRAGIFANPIN